MLTLARLRLQNWRNFPFADLSLEPRMFVAGPNASGKSNLLDALRFLGDVARPGGGLQHATRVLRGGLGAIRSGSVRPSADVSILCEIADSEDPSERWRYVLSLNQVGGGIRDLEAAVKAEEVWHRGERVLSRSFRNPEPDPRVRGTTALEQPMASSRFHPIAELFAGVRCAGLEPPPGTSAAGGSAPQPLAERVAAASEVVRASHLRRIAEALLRVPSGFGAAGLRPDSIDGLRNGEGAASRSAGESRLLALAWELVDGRGPLLVEEPECSLPPRAAAALAPLIASLQRRDGGRRQVIAVTHSAALLTDAGIRPEEVAALCPGPGGTEIRVGPEAVRYLLAVEAAVPETSPPQRLPEATVQLDLDL